MNIEMTSFLSFFFYHPYNRIPSQLVTIIHTKHPGQPSILLRFRFHPHSCPFPLPSLSSTCLSIPRLWRLQKWYPHVPILLVGNLGFLYCMGREHQLTDMYDESDFYYSWTDDFSLYILRFFSLLFSRTVINVMVIQHGEYLSTAPSFSFISIDFIHWLARSIYSTSRNQHTKIFHKSPCFKAKSITPSYMTYSLLPGLLKHQFLFPSLPSLTSESLTSSNYQQITNNLLIKISS